MKNRFFTKSLTLFLITGLLLVMLPIAPSGAAGKIYYVAKNGSDSNPGTATAPFLTIKKAAEVAQAGDTVYVRAGSYNERVYTPYSGSPGYPITFSAYPGERVVMKGFNISQNYITVKGFEITGTTEDRGIGILFTGSNLQILNNYIHHVTAIYDYSTSTTNVLIKGNKIIYPIGMGIVLTGSNHLVEDNEIAHSTNIQPDTGQPSGDADAIRFFGSGHVIRNNYIHDLWASEAPGAHMDAFQTFDTANNITFENNYVYNIAHQAGLLEGDFRGTVSNLTFKNNVFAKIGLRAFIAGKVPYLKFINNTFVDVRYESLYLANGSYNATIKNNIFYRSPSYRFEDEASKAGLSADYNLFYSSAYGLPEVHGISGKNPLFVDEVNGNFKLQAGSPAIDSADANGASLTDKDGNGRYDDPATPNTGSGSLPYYDRGAYEFQGSGQIVDLIPPSITVTNPANNATVAGTVSISANASDNIGVTKVEIYINNVLKATLFAPPYSYNWDSTAYADGSHVIKAKAYDGAGLTGEQSVTVNVKNSQVQPVSPVSDSSSAVLLSSKNSQVSAFSHEYSPTGKAAYLIDGKKQFNTDYTGWWIKKPVGTEYVVLAFDNVYTISQIDHFNDGYYGAKAVTVKYSTDNVNWQTLGTFNLNASGATVNKDSLSFTPVDAKYLKFEYSLFNTSSWLQIDEVEVWGVSI